MVAELGQIVAAELFTSDVKDCLIDDSPELATAPFDPSFGKGQVFLRRIGQTAPTTGDPNVSMRSIRAGLKPMSASMKSRWL